MLNKRRKILVVDDEQAIVRALSAIFESQSYETATANSGEEEVQVASSFQPECIVSDVKMGTMNGIEAAMEILSGLPQCKVLLMSGDAPCLDLLENAIAKGFNFEVLQKPVPVSELLTRVSQLLSNPSDQAWRLPITSKTPGSVSVEEKPFATPHADSLKCGKKLPYETNVAALETNVA